MKPKDQVSFMVTATDGDHTFHVPFGESIDWTTTVSTLTVSTPQGGFKTTHFSLANVIWWGEA